MIAGKRHGDITTRVANDIKYQRRLALGLEKPPSFITPPPTLVTPEVERRRALEGGIVIVGRPTFKEYMAGLRRGWTENLQRVDPEEQLAIELRDDGRFDEPESEDNSFGGGIEGEPIPTPSRLPVTLSSPSMPMQTPAQPSSAGNEGGADIPPPEHIPPQPPLLLAPFFNRVGLIQIPLMVWDFFNERYRVRSGAEAAYRLIMCETRPFIGPQAESASQFVSSDKATSPSNPQVASDLAFDIDCESYYKSSTASIPSDIQKARDSFYKELPAKLATARALAFRDREPTSDEIAKPPPTEVELRAERLKKELRWRGDEKGWDIVRPDSPVQWDQRMEDALKVFVDSSQHDPSK